MKLSSKIVVITGASSGIGAAAAQAFATAGALVVLAARDQARLAEVAARIGPSALAIPTDMTNPVSVAALIQHTVAAHGGIDIVINNAGVGLAAPISELDPNDLQAALAVNLFGPLALTQAALPFLRRRRGQVIFVSSVVGLRALPYLGGYAATKAALDRLTESLRVELAGSGVAITLIRPGTTSSAFSQRRLGSGHERRRMHSKAATPEQVAAAIVRAAKRRSRISYVNSSDRLNILFSLLAPKVADRLLQSVFTWETGAGAGKKGRHGDTETD